MYQGGVDYIQTNSAATDAGIIQAANEGEGRMVSAISPAQYKLGPNTVVALVALDFGQSLYNEVSKAIGPDFKGGHVQTGLGTGVIDSCCRRCSWKRARPSSSPRPRRCGRRSTRPKPRSSPAR